MFGFFKKKTTNPEQRPAPKNPSAKMSLDEYKASVLLVDMYMVWNDCIQQGQDKYREQEEAKEKCSSDGIRIEIYWGKSSKTAKEVWWSKNGERFFWGYE